MDQASTSQSPSDGNGFGNYALQPKHKVFLSHSGVQKGFVEQLCVDLERRDRHPFFDKRRDCLPIGKDFPSLIFEAIKQCEVGVVVLSEDFFTSKWPMLELVAMANVKKRNPSFILMPIFFGITFSQCRDVENHKRWLLLWHAWAKCDSRIDVKEWENALQLFGPTNGLKYNFELGEVKFREEIVEAICKLVPPRTRFEDSHVQGRSRLCKVIHERIEKSKVQGCGVHIVGLYGIGGIGKTTICKVMCNDLLEEFHDKVCHVELKSESESEVGVLKEVLGKLTDKNLDYLGAKDVDKYRDHLMRDMMNVKVFLTIDNVSSATTNQAMNLLRAKYGLGSVVLVTARSVNVLMSLGINATECMEMPELEMEEAKSLFLYHATCVPPSNLRNEVDLSLISCCVKRCHFKKGDGSSSHYHPLALQVLGEQLRCIEYDRMRWQSLLDEIDFLNPSRERQHPVFSILRSSFDALNPQDQLLFMDVALFAPYSYGLCSFKWNVFEWLGMVYGICVKSVMERLENLKKKSVLENLGDGRGRIGMHDLWHEFARLESKSDKFEDRQWIFEWDEDDMFGAASLTWGGGLVNCQRMFFSNKGFMKFKYVDFSYWPNLTILKIWTNSSSRHNLDFRGLKHLKSLELECALYLGSSKPLISVVGLGSLTKLFFLRWSHIPSNSSCIDEINFLTNLRVLDLEGCSQAPNLKKLISLQVFRFCNNKSVTTILGLSSKHTNLQFLDLGGCEALQSCWGVDQLVALQELCLTKCFELQKLPNLQKLKKLQKLKVNTCSSLPALLGLGDLVNLVQLNAFNCWSLVELPDMHNLKNLRTLHLWHCYSIKSLPNLDELISLESLDTRHCENLIELPNMDKLTNLKTLMMDPNNRLQSFMKWNNLISLHGLEVGTPMLYDGFDLCNFTNLEWLNIIGRGRYRISSQAKLISLESIKVDNCKGVHVLPDLKRLSKLRNLNLRHCEFEDLFGLCNVISLERLNIISCKKLQVLPNLQELVELQDMEVRNCALLKNLHGILGLQNLKRLYIQNNPLLHKNIGLDHHQLTGLLELNVSNSVDLQWLATCSQLCVLKCSRCPIEELPDLVNFPKLSNLSVCGCVNLMNLTCSGPFCPNLRDLNINDCKRLQTLPDFTNLQQLRQLIVVNSGVVLSPEFIQDMKERWPSIHLVTNETLPQVQSQGTSHGIWPYIFRKMSSFHSGCLEFFGSYSS